MIPGVRYRKKVDFRTCSGGRIGYVLRELDKKYPGCRSINPEKEADGLGNRRECLRMYTICEP